jgi:hypothetical protein
MRIDYRGRLTRRNYALISDTTHCSPKYSVRNNAGNLGLRAGGPRLV